MSKEILKIIDVKKTYKHMNKSITLFENLNLKIDQGELVALVGPSGSGKSSLLHIIGLLDEPSKGKIFINNQDTSSFSNSEKDRIRSNSVSIIFQDNNLLTDFTALENVMMPLIIKDENKKIVLKAKILKDLRIENRHDHFPNQLSGGEQQRLP